MTVTLSRERLEWLSEISGRDDFEDIDGDEIREMARSVLASLNAEPVCRDAQRRAGITDEQITRSMAEKLEVNKTRQWPEPKDGEPRLHIKEQPAPVVPEEVMPGGLACSIALPVFEGNDRDKIIGYRCFISGDTRIVESQEQAYADGRAVVNACRAVMLQGKTSAVEPEEFLICDLCGHDAWHQGDRTYECTEGHVFGVRAPKSGEVSCG